MGKRKPNYVAFIVGLGLVIGPRIMALNNFGEMLTPAHVGLFITDVSGVALAWMSNGYSLRAFIEKRNETTNNKPDGEK